MWAGLYDQMVDPVEMTTLPKALRARLDRELPSALELVAESVSDKGTTVKWLWGLEGGAQVETVLMLYPDRATVCVSSQAGCAMGCGFCATGQAGFERHLTTGEIVEQVVRATQRARATDRRVSNVVFMGMGEPFANYDRTWQSVERLHDDLGLSARHLTVSTVGIMPGIRRLAGERLPVNLAVSLHAANDELRNELVPINRRYPLDEVVAACQVWIAANNRRLSFEWALIDGVNDRRSDASELALIAAPASGAREPDPAEPDAGLADTRHTEGEGGRVPRPAEGARSERDGARKPRHRHRRRVRSARRVGVGAQPTCDVRPAQYGARSSRLRILPEPVRGSSSMNDTLRGTL